MYRIVYVGDEGYKWLCVINGEYTLTSNPKKATVYYSYYDMANAKKDVVDGYEFEIEEEISDAEMLHHNTIKLGELTEYIYRIYVMLRERANS